MPYDDIKRLKMIPDISSEDGIVKVIRAFVLTFMGRKDDRVGFAYGLNHTAQDTADISLEVSGFNVEEPNAFIGLAKKNFIPNILGELREVSKHDLSAITNSWRW